MPEREVSSPATANAPVRLDRAAADAALGHAATWAPVRSLEEDRLRAVQRVPEQLPATGSTPVVFPALVREAVRAGKERVMERDSAKEGRESLRDVEGARIDRGGISPDERERMSREVDNRKSSTEDRSDAPKSDSRVVHEKKDAAVTHSDGNRVPYQSSLYRGADGQHIGVADARGEPRRIAESYGKIEAEFRRNDDVGSRTLEMYVRAQSPDGKSSLTRVPTQTQLRADAAAGVPESRPSPSSEAELQSRINSLRKE